MRPNVEEMRSVLQSCGILADTHSDEICVVVVPSKRLKAGRFGILLQANGLHCRALGHGDGRVTQPDGQVVKVRGILVLAVAKADAKKLALYARLFGITTVPISDWTPAEK